MANPTTVINRPAIIDTSATEASIVLDPHWQYMVWHMGVDNEGNTQAEAIYVSSVAAVDEDASEGADKLKIEDAHPFPYYVGPGWSALYMDATANDPTFAIAPVNFFGGVY